MTALSGRTPAATFGDILQVSNSNSGIDGTLRSVSDGGGTSSPLQLSSTAGAWASGTFTFNGTANFDAATVSFANDAIAVTDIDWSGTDTLDGAYTFTGTANLSGATVTLPDNNVSLAKMADGTQGGVLIYGASGAPTELAAGTADHPLVTKGAGANAVFQQLATAGIADEAVTNAKLAHVATSTIKGRVTASTGDVEDLTATQALSVLGIESYDSGEQSLPSSGSTLQLAHGFTDGDHVQASVYLKCTTTDNGWAVGDFVHVPGPYISGASEFGFAVSHDGTNFNIVRGASGTVLYIKSTGEQFTITDSSWRLVVFARRFAA